jgi:hypothetical protein
MELKMQPTIHFRKKLDKLYSAFYGNVLWVAFSILSGSLSLVKYPVYLMHLLHICFQLYFLDFSNEWNNVTVFAVPFVFVIHFK